MNNCFFASFRFFLLSSAFVSIVCSLDCEIPKGCRLELIENGLGDEESVYAKSPKIWCEFNDDFYEFKFDEKTESNTRQNCSELDKKYSIYAFRWTTSSNKLALLETRFNFSKAQRYFSYFKGQETTLHTYFIDIKGFDINILDYNSMSKRFFRFWRISFVNCHLDFYHVKRKINSCQEFIKLNLTQIESIFQIKTDKNNMLNWIELNNVEYKHSICPFLFSNTNIRYLTLTGLIDTFYKTNVLSFSNETFPTLNSKIIQLSLYRINSIKLDLNLVHRSVFNVTSVISINGGSLNSISEKIFRHMINLSNFKIYSRTFRKINHKQGIEWIRQMNYDLNVNFSNLTIVEDNKMKYKTIFLNNYDEKYIPMFKTFPDEDFCVYIDFPFNQLIIVIIENFSNEHLKNVDFSCTFLYLIQYYEFYNKYILENDENYNDFMKEVLNSSDFKSKSKCNFEQKISACNKSNYKIKDIWDQSDYIILNKKIQIAFKISVYPICLFGLITNFIVVYVILNKDNSDLFKKNKQYTYLWLNSLFCMIILVIELLSWMTECFYPFEVFCPEIRKIAAIQFFKIIFKECFVTMLRFMLNFTYVAFALNRISLIGREHGKIVTFMSELGVKKYIGISLFISCFFSWIKGFRYEVNYLFPELNFPIPKDEDLMLSSVVSTPFDDFTYTFNLTSDLMNYLLFVVLSVIIDICMVVQLRRTLEEKIKKIESLNQKQSENKKAEFEEAVNKAIKMVVLNSVIGIFFKLPVCFFPFLKVYGLFYFKNAEFGFSHPSFSFFYSKLYDGGFYSLIQDITNFLFTFTLSIQIFIYNRFDKKFHTGFDRLANKLFLKIKNIFKSNNNSNL